MMCTPPAGMVRPLKKCRMSSALADQGKPCSRMMTDIFNSSVLEEDDDLEVIIQVLSVASAEQRFKVGECMGKHAQYSHSKSSLLRW